MSKGSWQSGSRTDLAQELEDRGLIPDITSRYDSWYDASVGVPGDGSGGETINLTLDYDGPNEITIKDGDDWELSFEGRTDEVSDKGTGLDSLIAVLNRYGAKIPPAAPEQPEEMGMHNPFESRLETALDEGIGSAIGGGLGKAAGWAAGQLAAGAKGFVKGAGAAYKGVDAKPAAPAAPAAAKPGMAKPAAAKPVVAGKPAAKKAYEQEVYNKAISSSDEGEFLGNLRYFYNWAKSPQGKDRVVPRQLEKMMAYAVFKYLTNPSFTMSSAKDIMKNVSIPISGADFDGKPEPAGKPEAEAEKTPTPVSVKAPEKAEEPAKKEEPKAEKPEAKKEPEKEEAKKESKDKNWDGWLSEVVADWV